MGSTNTAFEFDFSVKGEEWPFYLESGEFLKTSEDGEMIWLLTTIGSFFFLCLCIGAPLGCCFSKCCNKMNDNSDTRVYDAT